jgi:chromosome segregation ATPase
MDWLNDRQLELDKAQATKTGLEPQLLRHLEWRRQQEREIKRLNSLIYKYTKHRQQIRRNMKNTEELKWDLESELEDVERTIKLCVL